MQSSREAVNNDVIPVINRNCRCYFFYQNHVACNSTSITVVTKTHLKMVYLKTTLYARAFWPYLAFFKQFKVI